MSTLILLVVSLIQLSEQQQPCFKPGECKDSFQISGQVVDNQYLCRKECLTNPYCNSFTFFKKTNYCELYRNCAKLDKSCTDCLTGERDCSAPEIKCWLTGRCPGQALTTNTTQSSEDCLKFCQKMPLCNWFTFDEKKRQCSAYANCSSLEGCDSCTSGNSKCDITSKGKEE